MSFKILIVNLLDLLTHLGQLTVLDFAHFVGLSSKDSEVSPLGKRFHSSLLLCVVGETLDLDEGLSNFLDDQLLLAALGLPEDDRSRLHQLERSAQLLLPLFGLAPLDPVLKRRLQLEVDDLVLAHHVHGLQMDELGLQVLSQVLILIVLHVDGVL